MARMRCRTAIGGVTLGLAISACTGSTGQPTAEPATAAAAPPATAFATLQPFPPGNTLATVRASGDKRLPPVRVTEPSTLFFRCEQGSNATVEYGSGSQSCPNDGALLGIDLAPLASALPLRVTADGSTEWSLSVGTNIVR